MATSRPPKRGGKPAPRKSSGGPGSRKSSGGPGSRKSASGAERRIRKAQQAPKPAPPRSRKARPSVEPGTDRLNKILAAAGLGSRRAVEEYILQGRITVDGKVVRDLATRVNPDTAKIELDGELLKQERFVYFGVNKPKGYVSTNSDPAGRPRVVDLLPEIPQRVYTVGRLDENSNGLILLTNDGELANRLTHPRYGVEKVYHALVAGLPEAGTLDQLVVGVWLAEGKVRAKRVRIIGRRGDATMLEIILAEGKNREVRRMLAKLGHKVMSLTRVAVGPISVKGLKTGSFRPLTSREVGQLRQIAEGIAVPTAMTDPAFERREERGSGRGARGPARHDRPAGNATGRGRAPSSSAPTSTRRPASDSPPAPATGRPAGPASSDRPAGPAAGRPPRPTGPRAGSSAPRSASRSTQSRRPPSRRGAAEDGPTILPLPDESAAPRRKIIGLSGELREAAGGSRAGGGSARPRPPRRAGGPPPRPRPGGGTSARDDAPPPPKARRKSNILRRPRRARPGDEA